MALCEFLARGMSFSAIAKAINDKFGTSYTRNAAIGRSKRMGLRGPAPAEKRLERALKAESAGPKLSKKPKRSETVLVPEAPGLAPRRRPNRSICAVSASARGWFH
jgi:GcrA cell cycle regulator